MGIPTDPNVVTLADVAREAGVSLKTASRALNKEKYVKEETAAKGLRGDGSPRISSQ